MNLRSLMDHEEALTMLRQARDFAEHGWILKGRESVHHMVLDCLDRAAGQQGFVDITHPSGSIALSCVCRALYGNDPGTTRGRLKMIAKWNHTAGGTQDGSIRVLREAVGLATQKTSHARIRSTATERGKARKQCRQKARQVLQKAADLFGRTGPPEERIESVHGTGDSVITAALEIARGNPKGYRLRGPLRWQAEPHVRVAVQALYETLVTPYSDPGVHMRRIDVMTARERNGDIALERIAEGFKEAIELV